MKPGVLKHIEAWKKMAETCDQKLTPEQESKMISTLQVLAAIDLLSALPIDQSARASIFDRIKDDAANKEVLFAEIKSLVDTHLNQDLRQKVLDQAGKRLSEVFMAELAKSFPEKRGELAALNQSL